VTNFHYKKIAQQASSFLTIDAVGVFCLNVLKFRLKQELHPNKLLATHNFFQLIKMCHFPSSLFGGEPETPTIVRKKRP